MYVCKGEWTLRQSSSCAGKNRSRENMMKTHAILHLRIMQIVLGMDNVVVITVKHENMILKEVH